MEKLRRSLEQLTTPICNTCKIEMAWSRSVLIADEQMVQHVFVCPRCYEISETRTPLKPKE
jgi:hypothetical protein